MGDMTAGAAGMSVQAKNTPKELFKNNLYILLVFSPDSTRDKIPYIARYARDFPRMLSKENPAQSV